MARNHWKLDPKDEESPTSYWASYSDLMAGILLVFALAAAASWVELKGSLVEPTETLNAWEQYLDAVCDDKSLGDLAKEGVIKIDCDTGSLVISESSLRFPRGGVELSEEGRVLLERVVPIYLGTVEAHLDPSRSIDIDGIEIRGHTDSSGDYGSNTYIGRERAGNVLVFLVDSPALELYRNLLKDKAYTAGYADSRPPAGVERGGETELARRIEIQVKIDNVSILKDLRLLLNRITGADAAT